MLAGYGSMEPRFDGIWGDWGTMEYCGGKKGASYATGYKLKVQGAQGGWHDDTSLNSICLRCAEGNLICSKQGDLGDWYNSKAGPSGITCPGGFNEFSVRFEENQGKKDDTAANDFSMGCKDTSEWGETDAPDLWGKWSGVRPCPHGPYVICGIQTRVEANPNSWWYDGSALNGVKLACCERKTAKWIKPEDDPCGLRPDKLTEEQCKTIKEDGNCKFLQFSMDLCGRTCNPQICPTK